MSKEPIRGKWGVAFFILGVLLILRYIYQTSTLQELIKQDFLIMLWCLGWALSGTGIFLYMSRYYKGDKDSKDNKENKVNKGYYFLAFSFVSFISAIASFLVFLKFSSTIEFAYVSSALTALILGLGGDSLLEKIKNYKPGSSLPDGPS